MELVGGVLEPHNYIWDTNTMSWIKMQQPLLNAGSVTIAGSVTVNQGTPAAASSKWPIEIVDSGGVNIATVTAANAVKVDGSAVTQPVNGTVTANAGSGTFNTSDNHTTAAAPLAVELSTGAAFYTAAQTGQLPAALDGSGFLKVHEQGTASVSGAVTANAGSGTFTTSDSHFPAAGALADNLGNPTTTEIGANLLAWDATNNVWRRVQVDAATGTLKVDGSGATQPVSGTITANQGTANATPWNENVAQFGGTNVSTGTGASGAGIPRITVSNDSNVLATQSGTWTVQPGNTPNTVGNGWLIEYDRPTTARLTSSSVSVSASGDNTLVTGVVSQTIRVFRLVLVFNAAVNIFFKDSTPTTFTGTMNMTANGTMVLDFSGEPWFVAASGKNFVINLSSAQQVSGIIYYVQS